MSSKNIGWAVLGGVLAMTAGCGTPAVPTENSLPARETPPPKPREKKVFRLDAPIDISLADWLAKPRSELAQLAEELADKIQLQEKNHRQNIKPYSLLPDLCLPLAVPVFRQAKYSPALKMSLPPYLAEEKKDSQVALHLARFGDVEAALRLADRAGDKVTKRIKRYRFERNYPVEWTRLVGLQLHVAQIGLAAGELESARQVVGLHKQLARVLTTTTPIRNRRAHAAPLASMKQTTRSGTGGITFVTS
jgi:hypothetical protein